MHAVEIYMNAIDEGADCVTMAGYKLTGTHCGAFWINHKDAWAADYLQRND